MNKLIDLFVRSNATLALQRNLMLNTTLAADILEACTPAEMVMLNANLPHLKSLLLSACEYHLYDKTLYDSMDECILIETFGKLRVVSNLNLDFINFYEAKLRDLIKDSLRSLISALLSFKNDLGITPTNALNFITHISNETEQQKVITYAKLFTDIAKREIINAVIAHDSIDERPPLDMYMSIILNIFPHFSPSSQYQLITPNLIAQITYANFLLVRILDVDEVDRFNVLHKISVSAMVKLEDNIFQSLDKVFYLFQTDEPISKQKLKSTLCWKFIEHLPMQFINSAEAWEFASALFNDKTLTTLLNLPHVNAINGSRHLDSEIIKQNQVSLREAFIAIRNDGELTHPVKLQSLPVLQPPVETTSFNYPYLLGAGGCLLFVAIAAHRTYSFFQKPKIKIPPLRGMLSGSNDFALAPSSPEVRYKSL